MRLTRIELYGFKSFADRVQLDLPRGLTAIVGPNGCGKSNVMDAIRWALGEQRASVLRGDEMLDVVFKGNGARAARNFAEVSLYFDNTDGALPVEFNEVVITRRLYRSGESEYLLNRQNVRLKDVRALLMDTGLGTSAYSVMEQGRIDQLLSADPAERRRVFEEAAGISRYRAQARESASKLERTEQNVLRLGDVVEELEKQSRSLKYQAGRARSYLEARDRLAALKARFYAASWAQLGARQEQLVSTLRDCEAEDKRARQRLLSGREALAALQETLAAARGQADAAAEALRQATSSVDALAGRRDALREKRADVAARRAALDTRRSALQEALRQAHEEVLLLQQRAAATGEQIARAEEQAELRRQGLEQAERALAQWRADEEQRRQAALERLAELTECSNRRSEQASRHSALMASRDRLAERGAVIERQLEEHADRHGLLAADAQSLDSHLQAASQQVEAQRAHKDELAADIERLDEHLQRMREELAAADGRRTALTELIAHRDGVSPGAITLLDSGLPGIEGLLVDHLRVPLELADAVEAALGASTQALVVSSREAGLAALAHLHRTGAGRVLLLPRGTLRRQSAPAAGERLLDRIEVSGERELVEALLGHVRLVPNRAALADCQPDGQTLTVTPEGDLLDQRGVLRGGRSGQESGLVTRRAECRALEQRIEQLRADLLAAGEQRASLMAALVVREGDLQSATASVRRIEAEAERQREQERQLASQRQALERERDVLRRDLQELERELRQAASQLALMSGKEQELGGSVADDQRAAAEGEQRRASLQADLQTRQEELNGARLELSTLREREAATAGEARHVERALAERTREMAEAGAEIDALVEQDRAASEEERELEQRESVLVEERDQRAGSLAGSRQRVAELGDALRLATGEVTEAEADATGRAEQLIAARLQAQELDLHREHLRERTRAELEVDIQELAVEEQGEASEAELEELKERLSRMGNVNLAAIEELAQVEERLSFLVGQRDDLVAAKAALLDTIAQANRESRDRFTQTFDEVATHFRAIFRKLFHGGKADIALQEGVDVLEAGVEITVAPPGKDSRSITLLSGGERTLTAVGLLFALFRTRPSPMCLLDEVDAALDEANIDRFCGVLEDFLQDSQFLVVTHARRTMSYADTLYGITMQEHGVSRALSLKLAEYAEARTRVAPALPATGSSERVAEALS